MTLLAFLWIAILTLLLLLGFGISVLVDKWIDRKIQERSTKKKSNK